MLKLNGVFLTCEMSKGVKKQLTQNSYLYLSYEINDKMTYNNGISEISKKRLLNILKYTLNELPLNFL